MIRKTQKDWFQAGANILSTQGAQALTIDRLAIEMRVTKGSFYHHFVDLATYKRALLSHVESEDSTRAIAYVEQGRTPIQKLQRMFDWASNYPQDLALAMQAWALQDDDVRQVQARVYTSQLEYATKVCYQLLRDKAQARLLAQMAFSMLIGSLHVQNHLPKNARRKFFKELQRVYELE